MNKTILVLIGISCAVIGSCMPEKYSVSPDGRIAIPGGKSVYVTDKDASFLDEIVSNEPSDIDWLNWSPDGSKLLYISDNIYIVDRDGKNKKKIDTELKNLFLPEWSPDMRYISYAGESKTNKDEGWLCLHDITAGRTTTLVKNSWVIHKWSPDSRKIFAMRMVKKIDRAFESGREIMSGEIISVDVATGRITVHAPYCATGFTVLDYHPASRSIIFTSLDLFLPGKPITPDEETNYGLYAVNLDSGRISRITNERPIMYFSLSPKKEKILYVLSNRPQELLSGDLYVTDINGRNKIRIGENSDNFVPFWASEDTVGYQDWIGEGDARQKTVWVFDLTTGKKANFTERIEKAKKAKEKKK